MLLHFLYYDPKFTRSMIGLIQRFNPSEHVIVVYGGNVSNKTELLTDIDNVILGFKGNIKKVRKLMALSDGIIFHGLFDPKMILMLFINRSILKKSNWVAWGGDIYGLGNPDDSIKRRIKFYLLRSFAGKFKYLTTLADGDYDVAIKKFNMKSIHLRGMYINPNVDPILKISEDNIRNTESVINIQVGNSATKSNHQIEAFDILARFKNENIRIYAPLSYGDCTYAKKVINYGKNVFGKKFAPLTELVDIDTYNRYLSKIHIGIFNNDRQQGMGNIGKLLFFGAKVYLRNDTSMWDKYINFHKYHLFDIDDIRTMKFEEFMHFDVEKAIQNKNIYLGTRDITQLMNTWQTVFNTMMSKSKK